MDKDKGKLWDDDENIVSDEELNEINKMLAEEGLEPTTQDELRDIGNALNEVFSFLGMALMSEPIKRTTTETFKVDTAKVFGMKWKYEIAVCHIKFNNNNWIIVASAETEEEALKKHDFLVNKFSKEKITYIRDIFDGTIYLEDT